MSKETLEHLSSLMDGELSREASLFLTRRLFSDNDMCATWERYHLIRDCIRQPGSKQAVSGMCARVSATLEAESVPAQSSWQARRWIKPASGLAIAASVALMAIIVTAPQPGALPGTGDSALSEPVNQPFVSPNTLPRAPVSQAVNYEPGQQNGGNRLNVYLLRHNQMARTAGRQGFVSFVPIVATPAATLAQAPGEASESAQAAPVKETAENK